MEARLLFADDAGEAIPGIQSGGVAVGPDDFQGVIACEAHVGGLDIVGNAVGIEDFFPGELVDAAGARAGVTDGFEREAVQGAVSPLEFQHAFTAEGSDFRRWRGNGVAHAGIICDTTDSVPRGGA